MSEESDPVQCIGKPLTGLPLTGLPPKQGLYDPAFEHDACGTGFVVNIKGVASHDIVMQGLTILDNLAHRGASGSEAASGDGAGILIQLPHAFLRKECAASGFDLPGERYYGVGMIFFPADAEIRAGFELQVEQIAAEEDRKSVV